MRIGVIQASSQATKNELLYTATKESAEGHEVINFGCDVLDKNKYSYVEISIAIGLLLASGAVDFIVTGCSSGQGMMLACNSLPGVICGYAPTPKDAYLFAQINNGNAISLPLGENYIWYGEENLKETIKVLLSEPFGQGYPKEDAARKLKDTLLLKRIRSNGQKDFLCFLNSLDIEMLKHILAKTNVRDYILKNGTVEPIIAWMKQLA